MRISIIGLLVAGMSVLALAGGCVSSEEAGSNAEVDSSSASRSGEERRKPRSSGPNLARQRDVIRTVQLYRGANERTSPIIERESGESLTLEFDLMEQEGRPLSIYFYHADRNWTRDLSPTQFLESYQDDDLVDYRPSQGTAVPYVHYTYRFPNDDIQFRLSGNYVLRVTERGRENAVLFERAFFVTDEEGSLRLESTSIAIPGQRQRSIRPVARFTPPAGFQGDPLGYTTCFVRNGRLSDTRCEDRPRLSNQPSLAFELDRSRAFDPVTANYTVDLSSLRGRDKIERTDRTRTPFRVLLEPDYARFSGRNMDSPLNGQILVRDALRGYGNPARTAEYVRTTFAFVPPNERPLSGEVVVVGSFSGMDVEQGTGMDWKPGRGRYEGNVLLKQGRYQYFYSSPDSLLQKTVRESQARLRSTYTSFVYYEDVSENTDRLLRVGSVQQ